MGCIPPGTERGAGVAGERRNASAAPWPAARPDVAPCICRNAPGRSFLDIGCRLVRNNRTPEETDERLDPLMQRGVHAVNDGRPRLDVNADLLEVGL